MRSPLRRLCYTLACGLLVFFIGTIGLSFAAANIVAPSAAGMVELPITADQLLPP